MSLVEWSSEVAAEDKCSILDFEHLFLQYYVEIRPRWHAKWAQGFSRLGRRMRCLAASPVVKAAPSAEVLSKAWKAEAVECIWRHRKTCQSRWPQLKFSKRTLAQRLEEEVSCDDNLLASRSRLVITLSPERVCHRLLWAIGDAMTPASILWEIENRLRKRLQDTMPEFHIRCTDDFVYTPSCFRTLFILISLLLFFCGCVLVNAVAAFVLWQAQHRGKRYHKHDGVDRDELLDLLAARILLCGAVAHLWMLHAIVMAFPLRSLHSPFKRDLGCLIAYSSTALKLTRFLAPFFALAMPVAMAVRFDRLGLALIIPSPGHPVGLHSMALFGAACLPLFTAAAAWSVRSSFFSHHQLFIVLLFLSNLGAAFGFVAYFEMVKWAVIALGGALTFALYLFSTYMAEFTSVSLHKAAQLQWACAHMVPLLMLVLAAALEVETGAARAMIEFFCSCQELMPEKMCVRLLSNGG